MTSAIVLSWMVNVALAQDSPIKYRISYRKSESAPWVFYADVRDEKKAEKIKGELHHIGYQGQVEPVSATSIAPPKAEEAPHPVHVAKPLAATPDAFSFRSRQYFPTPHVVPQQTGVMSGGFYSAFSNAGLPAWGLGVGGVGLGWGGGWGWGGWGSHPILNPQEHASRPIFNQGLSGFGVHPTYHPYAR